MAKQKTAYVATDGKEFPTALEADAHDLMLSQEPSVKAYAAAVELGMAETTRAKRYIAGYTVFMQTYVAPPPAAPAANEAVAEPAAEPVAEHAPAEEHAHAA